MPRLGRGLTIGQGLMRAGDALAAGMMQRANRKYQEGERGKVAEALMPLTSAEQHPQYDETMSLVDALVPPSPMQPLSPMDPSKAPTVDYEGSRAKVQENFEAAAAEKNAEIEKIRALMNSPDPTTRQYGMQMWAAQNMPKDKSKVTSVSGGYVDNTGTFIPTGKDADPLKDPTKRYRTFENQLLDFGQLDEDGAPKVVHEGPPGTKVQITETGAGGDDKQKVAVVTDAEGNVLSAERIGEKYSGTQKIETTNNDLKKDSKPYHVRMALDKEVLDNAAVRMDDIGAKLEDSYLTYWGKGAGEAGKILDKAQLLQFFPEEYKKYVGEFSQFQQDVNSNVNLYIKEITEDQMSEAEAGRLMKAMANLQDSPMEFKAKLANARAQLAAAQERKAKLISDLINEDPDLTYDAAKKEADRAFSGVTEAMLLDFERGADDPTPPGFNRVQ